MTAILKPSSIAPSIGRKMWVFIHNPPEGARAYDKKVPFDATVIYVWSPSLVNVRVTDHAGKEFVLTSMPVADYDESYEHGEAHCAAWMPYQTGQSKKSSEKPADDELVKLEENGTLTDAGLQRMAEAGAIGSAEEAAVLGDAEQQS